MAVVESHWDLVPNQSIIRKRYHEAAVMYEGIGSIPNAFYNKKRYWEEKEAIELSYSNPTTDFERLLRSRRTRRKVSDKKITLDFLAKLLQFCAGISDEEKELLTYPSPGATYPTTLFVYWNDGQNYLYRYNPFNHTLEKYSEKNMDHIHKIIGDKVLNEFPVFLFFASDYQLVEEKYGAISYRLLNQEMGHLAQNISLYCEQERYHSVCIGGFFQSHFQKIVGSTYDLHYVMVVG